MKKVLILIAVSVFAVSSVQAAPFAPTLLKLTADPLIQYDFDGSTLDIPLRVSGATAGTIFCVYTRGKADEVPNMRNGYLGWHHVNKVDTCIYYSPLRNFGIGSNTLTWNGKDQDGGVVAAGEYTYYIWAFDNAGNKLKMSEYTLSRSGATEVIEIDENGLPMTSPVYYENTGKRWVIGSDPSDANAMQTTNIVTAEGWTKGGTNYGLHPTVDPTDHDLFYIQVYNLTSANSAIHKYKYVPGGDAELQTDFGDDGYGGFFSGASAYQPGVCTDGNYLFTGDCHITDKTEPDAEFYIVDMDGFLIEEVDLTPWWSNPDDLEAGGQMNGGPNTMSIRNGMCFLQCHCSCIKQMVDPVRFLDSGDTDDLYVWTNMNGDYVLDHNFEETASIAWTCNDYNVGPYTYNMDADDKLFSACPAYDVGAVSFGLLGPDGTGIGYFAFAGETAGWKKGNFFIDGETPFDGLYCDNDQTGGPHYDWCSAKRTPGTFFIGHDVITGIISNAVTVEDNGPAAFAVSQNTPNPFNPTTTIGFSTAESGNVTIEVYNVAGQKIETLADGYMEAGTHSVVWDASAFSAGVYFYTVKSNGHSKTLKMTLLK